jgi:ribosomal protein S18 acetylase RimI-like enzyme
MVNNGRFAVRPAGSADRNSIIALIRFEPHVHAHLDWKPPEEWLGRQPYLVAERGRRIIGALACPPDPPDTAWLRLFAVVADSSPPAVWDLIWPLAQSVLEERGVRVVAALSMVDWFGSICAHAGFQQTHAVVVLSRPRGPLSATSQVQPAITIRQAGPADYVAIAATDLGAFTTPWQMSGEVIRQAIPLAELITVAEVGGQIVGYQLTTPSQEGAHLARLAVLPSWQGNGIAKALVSRLIEYYNGRNIRELTVNTQDTNAASLAVYRQLGFTLTGTYFPVYQLNLAR